MQVDEATHRSLIDACNILCQFVEGKLPPGYEIVLTLGTEEATCELHNWQTGEEHYVDTDRGRSVIVSMIEAAWENEAYSQAARPIS